MSDDNWSRVKRLFEEARSLAPSERGGFLASACGEDTGLRAEVERLLSADDDAEHFFDTLGRDIRVAEPAVPLPERLGSWRVLREIGHGGMGSVLLAERDDGQYRQRAAIKLVHAGLAPDLIARFRAERQILARLDHPGISRLIDGGVADDGRPYLVMEYVDGEPITNHADRHRLSVSERLALFQQAGDAVAYAHRRLVVHRDIKPSNVLVDTTGDEGPRVKLLDFGIAKLLEEQEGVSQLTQIDGRMMTPAYASPEQIRGEPATTSTDVYALGVLLYELLTGHRPYRPPTRGRHDVETAILEETPTEPSTAVGRASTRRSTDGDLHEVTPADVSAARATEPRRLRRALKGDLDRIVMKALSKEPDRRYGTAEAFVRDVERHVAGLPVEARHASVRYRVSRFVRRHRVGVATTASVFVLAVAFGALYTLRVARERVRAEAQRDRAERVTAFLTDMLAPIDEPDVDARALLVLLEPAAQRAVEELEDDPTVQATVFHTLGQLYDRSGRPDRALPLLRRALALRRAIHAGPHRDMAATHDALGMLFVGRDRDSALGHFRDAAALRRQLATGDDHDLAWSMLHWSRMLPARHPDKQAMYREALGMLERIHGDRSPDVAGALHEYHVLGFADATGDEIEAAFREAIAIYEENDRQDAPTAIHAVHNLGLLLDRPGSADEALRLLRRSVAQGRASLPPGAPGRVAMAVNLGATLSEHGHLAEADAVLSEVVDEARHVLPDSAAGIGHSQYWYGINLLAMGRAEEAERALASAAPIYAGLAPDGERFHRVRTEQAAALVASGRHAEAAPILRASLEGLRGTPHEARVRALLAVAEGR